MTTQQHSMGNLSSFSASPLALSWANAFEQLSIQTLLQMQEYEINKTLTQVEKQGAKGISNAIINAGEEQGAATERQAISQIVQGSISVGLEGLEGVGFGPSKLFSKRGGLSKNLEEAQANSQRMDKWDEGVQNAEKGEGSLFGANFNDQEDLLSDNEIEQTLRSANVRKGEYNEAHADALETAYDKGLKSFDDIKEEVRVQKKAADKKLQAAQGEISSLRQRMSNIYQMLGTTISGALQMEVKNRQQQQAQYQAIQQSYQYFFDTAKQSFDTTSKTIDNMESGKMALFRMLEGLSQVNEVRG